MSKSTRKAEREAAVTLARELALLDMEQDGIDTANVSSETLADVPAPDVPAPDVPLPADIGTAFVVVAVSLLSGTSISVNVSVVLAEMVKRGFPFPAFGENDKAPKGKDFRLCVTERCAGTLYKFLTGTLRNKSSVMFSGELAGKYLYYSGGNVFASSPLPAESVNAWKDALRLSLKASGK